MINFVGDIIMPTPMAVLKGATLLAMGTSSEKGLGDLVVVDIGGATTDIDSLSEGDSSDPCIVQKGLKESYAKRTVEGDLGIRYNASHILDMVGDQQLMKNMRINEEELPFELNKEEVKSKVRYLLDHIGYVPQDKKDFLLDVALARSAAEIAMRRHAGRIEPIYTLTGTISFRYGKDLRGINILIGTGGIFSYGKQYANWILEGTRYNEHEPFSLRPKAPEFFIDELYILYAVGLLAEITPDKSLRIMKRYLRKIPLLKNTYCSQVCCKFG